MAYRIAGKKRALARLMMASGLHRAVRAFQAPSLTVFNYHRIRDGSGEGFRTEFDEDVFGPTAEEFRSHLSWLKSNSDVLSESDLLDSLRTGSRLPARGVMVTFDDGYLDNFELALPLLRELRVPATYFIPTQSIEERSLGWWDMIAYLLKRSSKPAIELYGERVSLADIPTAKVRLQRWMKLKGEAQSRTLVEDLARACDVAMPGAEICGRELMTWDQVRETAAAGISIGAHTHSHRVLATLPLDQQREELARGKAELERHIGMRVPGYVVRSLAYPVGGYEHFNLETQSLARECGYEAAFSFHTGVNRVGAIDPYDLKRVSAPDDIESYCGTLALPSVFGRRRCEASAPASVGGSAAPAGVAK